MYDSRAATSALCRKQCYPFLRASNISPQYAHRFRLQTTAKTYASQQALADYLSAVRVCSGPPVDLWFAG